MSFFATSQRESAVVHVPHNFTKLNYRHVASHNSTLSPSLMQVISLKPQNPCTALSWLTLPWLQSSTQSQWSSHRVHTTWTFFFVHILDWFKMQSWIPHTSIEAKQIGEDLYPIYKCPSNGQVVLKGTQTYHNEHLFLYSPWFILNYNVHINVEVAFSIIAIKYLYKYVSKEHGGCLCILGMSCNRWRNISMGYSSVQMKLSEALYHSDPFYNNHHLILPNLCLFWSIFYVPVTCLMKCELLESWPAVIRLGLHVEDHPLVYFVHNTYLSCARETGQGAHKDTFVCAMWIP